MKTINDKVSIDIVEYFNSNKKGIYLNEYRVVGSKPPFGSKNYNMVTLVTTFEDIANAFSIEELELMLNYKKGN